MSETLWSAVIGVGGTLLGTILGFLLGKITWGRLHVKIDTKNKDFDFIQNKQILHKLTLGIKLYNASGKNKIVNDGKLKFVNQDGHSLVVPIKDLDTLKVERFGHVIQEAGTINITPKSTAYINGQLRLRDNEMDLAKQAKTIFFQYQNAKFHTKTKKLCNYDQQQLLDCLMKDN